MFTTNKSENYWKRKEKMKNIISANDGDTNGFSYLYR